DRFVATPRNTSRLEAVGNNRVVAIEDKQWTRPRLIDAQTGAVLSQGGMIYAGALGATADGNTVFVGQSAVSSASVIRYSLATGQFTEIGRSNHGTGASYPARSAVAVPDGSGIYYAGYLFDGHNLGVLRYPVAGPILAVSPDGRLALSSSHVYDVATGNHFSLPVTASAVAISPNGAKAFLWTGSGIIPLDLTAF
ncbi:MAG TPA: hypothetical protein VK932_13475, partial [Kofleriaceae bacterium]|nr:hypothetical protein [Kofleriaceae bacterium]